MKITYYNYINNHYNKCKVKQIKIKKYYYKYMFD